VLEDFGVVREDNEKAVKGMLALAEGYNKSVVEEMAMTDDQLKTRHVGKKDPKRHLEDTVQEAMTSNIVMMMGKMLDAVSF